MLTGQYSHNHGVLGNTPPAGGFQAFDNAQHDRGLAPGPRVHDRARRQVPERLRRRGRRAAPTRFPRAGTSGYTGDGAVQAVYGYNLNENGTCVPYGPASRTSSRTSSPARGRADRRARRRRRPALPAARLHGAALGRARAACRAAGTTARTRPPGGASRDGVRHRAAAAGPVGSTRRTSATSRRRSRTCRCWTRRHHEPDPALPLPDRVASSRSTRESRTSSTRCATRTRSQTPT